MIRKFTDDFVEIVAQNSEKIMILLDDGIDSRTYTYKTIAEYIDRFLVFFEKQGLKPGDTILSILPNSLEAMVCFLATIKGGFGFAPLPCRVSGREISNWINLVKPKLCLKKKDLNYYIGENPIETDVTIIETECNSDFNWLPAVTSIISTNGVEPRVYLSTSGTTGESKAIVIDSNMLWTSGYVFAEYHHLKGINIRLWNYLPMSYLGGLFNLGLIPICSGGSIVIGEPFSGKTFLNFWNNVNRFDINFLWLVPTIAKGLLRIASLTNNNKITNISKNISLCFIGTAPVSMQLKLEFEEIFGIKVLENYALSETTFLTSETLPNLIYREEASVGGILPYVTLKLEPYKDEPDLFEIKAKSPFLFCGYLKADGRIELPLDEDGFFATGDTGLINKNGQLILTGRREDIIKRGGMLVSLQEVDLLISQLDYIEEAAAVKVKHDFYGESYVLFVVPKAGEADIENRLEKWFHNNMVNYKWPDQIFIKEDLIKTPSGKIKKKVLGELYDTRNTETVNANQPKSK